jgi:hypothetical protein
MMAPDETNYFEGSREECLTRPTLNEAASSEQK